MAILVHRDIHHSLKGSPGTKVLECIGAAVDSPSGALHFTSAYLPRASHSRDDLQKHQGSSNIIDLPVF
jgi:hypothetical protein